MKFNFLKIFIGKKNKNKNNSTKINITRKPKIGLVLSGGGTRGMAHLGALKAFEENNIKFDYVAGTSIGAIIGAFYCSQKFSVNQMIEMSKVIKIKDIKTSKIPFMPSKTDKMEQILIDHLGDIDIKQLNLPFAVVAVDMVSGEEVVFNEGRLSKVVTGSCAVPGIFSCVQYEKMNLADGGLSNNIPADVLKLLGCDYVVSIDLNFKRGQGTDSLKTVDLLWAALRILMKSNATKGKLYSDIIIEPHLSDFKSTKLDKLDDMINEGYRATMSKIIDIKNLLDPNKVKRRNIKIKEHKKQFKEDKLIDIDEEIDLFDKDL